MLRRGELTCRTEYSSAGERSLHTGEVVGSIPTAPTTDYPTNQSISGFSQAWRFATRGRTLQEHAATIRGKSGEFVLKTFSVVAG